MRIATLLICLWWVPITARAEDNANARRILEAVEQRLLDANYVDLYAHVSIAEPYKRQMSGSFIIDEKGHVTGSFRGTIGTDPAVLKISADTHTLKLVLNEEERNGTLPAEFRESVLVGLMRLGFAQSLISMSQLTPPEKADGGIREWVQYGNVRLREGAVGQGYHAGEVGLQFDLVIGGKTAGYSRLWISTQNQLPTRREQFLTYVDAEGQTREFQINESFSRFVVEP